MASDTRTTIDLAVIGERFGGHAPQETIGPALEHAADALGVAAPTVRWVATDDLAREGADGCSAAPTPSGARRVAPIASLDGALDGIRFAREHGVPFLGTCAGFQHAVIEVARNLAGIAEADHEEYGREGGDLVIHELLCSLVGQRLDVRIVDDVARRDLRRRPGRGALLLHASGSTRSTCPGSRRPACVVAGVDVADDQPRVMRLADHPYFVLTLFVPQTSSSPGRPHPLVTGLLSATAQRHVPLQRAGRGGPELTSIGRHRRPASRASASRATKVGCGCRTGRGRAADRAGRATTTSRGPFGSSSRHSARPVAATISASADQATSGLPRSLPFITACRPVIQAMA